MEKPEKYLWLDDALLAMEKAMGSMDLATLQPTSWRHTQPLFAAEWLEWFCAILDRARTRGVSVRELARAWQPGMCRDHFFFILEDLKSARWAREERLRVADFLYEASLELFPQGDIFGLGGTSLHHTPDQVIQIMQKPFVEGSHDAARELGRLYTGAYNLGAGLFLDFYMGRSIQNLGPYSLEDGRVLVIKEMRDFRPVEIWPEVETTSSTLTIYAVYKNVKFSTDMVTCHTHYVGDPIAGLHSWRLERDGRMVTDVTEIREIAVNLAQTSGRQWMRIKQLSEQELFKMSVRIRCYCFKELCDLVGMEWQTPREMLSAVEGKTLTQGFAQWHEPRGEEQKRNYWRNIWDPRIDFYP